MKTIFRLLSDTANFSSFIQDYDPGKEESIMNIVGQNWTPVTKYTPVKLVLHRSDTGKKGYSFDISSSLLPFYVFSERTLQTIKIIERTGQILPVVTDSKRKNFFGFYPTKTHAGCLDMEQSIFRRYETGLMIRKPVLIYKNLPDDELFTIAEDRRVFVTSDFKSAVEKAGLLGFDFSDVIATS